ncbi:MAG: cytochrome P450 [Bacteroidota bacterium]
MRTLPSTSRFWIKTALEMASDTLGTITKYHAVHGDVFKLAMGGRTRYIVVHPDLVDEVLVGQKKKFQKSKTYKELLPLLTGHGMIGIDGELWRKHRRIAQPAFHKKYLATIYEHKRKVVDEYLSTLPELPQPVIWNHEMTMLTLDVVTQALMGEGIKGEAPVIHKAIDDSLKYLIQMALNPIARATDRFTNRRKQFSKQKQQIDYLVDSMIASRRQEGNEGKFDLMAMLMNSHDEETQESLDDEGLKSEMLTIFLAGHETSANAMSWGIVSLMQNPNSWERLREEVDTVIGKDLPTFEQLFQLPYTRQVVDEILRLYPSAWAIGRTVLEPITLGGFQIPSGVDLVLPIYHVHRHPQFWENPDQFDPDRFSPSNVQEIHPKAYLPFGSGPRKCIGNHFAIIEMLLILTVIAQRLDLELLTQEVKGQASLTYRPITDIKVKVTPRPS